MFNVMKSRWFYLSDRFLIGNHPDTLKPILLLKQGVDYREDLTREVGRILELNQLAIAGELKEENGYYYYPLKERANVCQASVN